MHSSESDREMSPLALPLPGKNLPFPQAGALARLVACIHGAGGRPILVGGSVRDHFLGLPAKDYDVEVFGLQLDELEKALERAGQVYAVGRSFGVLKVRITHDGNDEIIDVALPRRESKSGRGHRGFIIASDPHMSFADAACRRDFTLNAMGIDLVTGEVLDPHGGVEDLARRHLRHVSSAFDEDPLRVLRACQMAARFGLTIDRDTLSRCHNLQSELFTLPKERIWEEFRKLLCRAPWPAIGLRALQATKALEIFPELAALPGCPQEMQWHPEGDVWLHTLLVVDEAAQLCRRKMLSTEETLIILLGALCHDLGKPDTTALVDGRIRSIEHEARGEEPTRRFLQRIGAPVAIEEAVVPLVKEHLKPFQLYSDRERVSDAAIRRLALRVPIPRLLLVSRADFLGRTTKEALTRHDAAGDWLMEQAERLRLKAEAPKPILMGRHLLSRGLKAGPQFKRLLEIAFEAQLEGNFENQMEAEAWLDEHLAEMLKDATDAT